MILSLARSSRVGSAAATERSTRPPARRGVERSASAARGWPRTAAIVLAASLFPLAYQSVVDGKQANTSFSDPLFLLFGLWLVWLWLRSELRMPFGWLCLLNLAAVAASTVYNHRISAAHLGPIGMAVWMFKAAFLWVHFYAVVNLLRDRSDWTLFLRSWIAAAAVVGATGYYGSYMWMCCGVETPYALHYRANGTLNDSNVFAMYMGVSFFLAWTELRLNGRRWWTPAAMAFCAGAVFMAGSRGGFLSIALAASLFWLFETSVPAKAATVLAGLLVVATVSLLPNRDDILRSNPITERLTHTTVNLNNPEAHERRMLWEQAIEDFLSSPVFGVGRGNYGQTRAFAPPDVVQAHNTYLGLLGEVGLFGALTYLSLGALCIWALAARNPWFGDGREWAVAMPLLAAVAMTSLSAVTVSIENHRTVWLLFGLLAAFEGTRPIDPDREFDPLGDGPSSAPAARRRGSGN